MKPHIRKFNGIWYCATYSTGSGMGYTPKEAFDDWKALRLARTSEAAGLEAT